MNDLINDSMKTEDATPDVSDYLSVNEEEFDEVGEGGSPVLKELQKIPGLFYLYSNSLFLSEKSNSSSLN